MKDHFYFYHLAPKGSDMSKGITSLEYQYQHDKKQFRKNSSKYRERLCNGWDIYAGRTPASLSDDEVYEGINQFRKSPDGCNKIYLFRYPPYEKLGKEMKKTLKGKDIYRVDINELRDTGIVTDIDFGYVDSNTDNARLTEKWYQDISHDDYFKNYTESDPSRLLFSYMNHIGVTTMNGVIPKRYITKIDDPESIEEYALLESKKVSSEIPEEIKDFNKKLNKFSYGVLKDGKPVKNMDNYDYYHDYKTMTPDQVEKFKTGVCIDYVRYEAKWFSEHGYKYDTYYIEAVDKDKDYPSHAFLIFYLPNSKSVFYFESSWKRYKGIEEFNSVSELLTEIKKRHVEDNDAESIYTCRKYNANAGMDNIGIVKFAQKASGGHTGYTESALLEGNGIMIQNHTCVECGYTADEIEVIFHKRPDYKRIHLLHPNWNLSNGKLGYIICSNCHTKNDILIQAEPIKESKTFTGKVEYLDISKNMETFEKYKSTKGYRKTYFDAVSGYVGEMIIDKDNDKLIGSVLVGNKRDKGFICDLEVYNPYKGYGFGTRLLNDAIKKYGGIDLTVSKSNKVAYDMYQRHGFAVVKDGKEVYMKLVTKLTKEEKQKVIGIKESALLEVATDDRKAIYQKALKEFKAKLKGNKLLTSKAEWGDDDVDAFYSKEQDEAGIYFADLWDLMPDARTRDPERVQWYETEIQDKLEAAAASVTEKLPKGYVIERDGDWDDMLYVLRIKPQRFSFFHRESYDGYISEAKLAAKERKELSDSEFGLPAKRKYPLTDAKHVKSAIRFFNYVDSEDEAELARNIKKKAIEYKVPIRCGDGNRLSKYITEEYIKEFMSVASIGNNMTAVSNGTLKQHLSQGDTVYCYDRKKPYTKRMKRGEDGMPEDGRKPIKENYVYSGKDLEFNLDKWKPGGKNVLFITGLSGSGKSTKAAKLAKEYNAINIELDLFEHNNILFNKNTHNDEANLIVKEYFEKKYGGPKKFKFSDPGTGRYIYEFIEYCIGYARQHKDRLFIMEGIQLADLEMDDELKDEPVIIVHSSILKSMYRAAKREGIKDYIKSFDSFKGVVEYFRWYKEMDKNNKRLSKAMKEDASDEEDTSDTFLDDILNSIKDLDEEFEPFPTDILNEKL